MKNYVKDYQNVIIYYFSMQNLENILNNLIISILKSNSRKLFQIMNLMKICHMIGKNYQN
jgi:hypothetical protein